jgi:hypothetical protein
MKASVAKESCDSKTEQRRLLRPASPPTWMPAQSSASRSLALSAVAPIGSIQRACGCGDAPAIAQDESIKRSGIQPALTISTPGDPSEVEADRVADEVMRMPEESMPAPRVRRLAERSSMNRACASCAAGESEMGALSSVVSHGTSGGGQALDDSTRGFMESRFDRDFGHVRLHTSSAAADAARSINALAYTVGSDIVFAAGGYQPHTNPGRRLLAHELTHSIQQNAPGGPVGSRVQRAPDEDCGDPQVKDKGLNCRGEPRHGRGEMVPTAAGWELRNFDVDKHFLKPEHEDALDDIADTIEAFLKANPGERVNLLGEASTTAGDCYNMRLSRRRTRCVAAALEARGISATALNLNWVGDRHSTMRLAAKPTPTPRDIENPNDRRVTISLSVPMTECSIAARLRSSEVLDFRFGCLTRNKFSVVIANRNASPEIYREFIWEKVAELPDDCEFFPDLDPTVTFNRTLKPARLALSEDAAAPSDFKSPMLQISLSAGAFTDPVSVLEFATDNDLTLVDFWGSWSPASCQSRVAAGQPLATIGLLKPAGPVRCGPMPTPASTKCATPTEEECPKERRQSSASHLKAKVTPVSGLKGKVIDWLTGKVLEGSEVRYLDIGTIKTDDQKNATGDDIWRRYLFISKPVYGPEGCEQRASEESSRGEAKLSDPISLDGVRARPATLTRKADSNAESLWIAGVGKFELFGEKCLPGGTQLLAGTIVEAGGVHCEPLELDAIPAEESCHDECPELRRTCTADTFLFRFGRMAPDRAPPDLRDALQGTGCDAEMARVYIGALSTHPIWRPFFWIQPTKGCPFNVEQTSLSGGGGKLTVGVKPKLKLLPPKIGLAPVFETDGLQLSRENPDDPASPSDFSMNTSVGGMALTGSHTETDWGISGVTRTRYQMATIGSPVSFKGSCDSSDGGLLIPAGAVACGLPPSPAHDPAPVDTCPSDLTTVAKNLAFFMINYGMIDSLHSHPGIVTPLELQGTPVYTTGQIVKEARFIGLTFTSGTTVEPVVVVFDMKVDDVTKIGIRFTVLSEPCTYLSGTTRVPFRLSSAKCEESLKQGQSYWIRSDFSPTPSGTP